MRQKGDWGKNAWYPIKGERIKSAFIKNATSAHVWAPTAGAIAINWMGWDYKMSKWVNKERTVYNEQHESDNYSDNFNIIQKYEMYASIFLTASMDEEENNTNYVVNKLRGGLLVSVASSASKTAHHTIRKHTNRRRPNSKDDNSLPSGHATEAGSRRVLIARNLESSSLSSGWQTGINTVNTTMSAAVMWARVEGLRHYPTDVLLGYALGSFVSGFIYDAFINLEDNKSFTFAPTSGGAVANLTIGF